MAFHNPYLQNKFLLYISLMMIPSSLLWWWIHCVSFGADSEGSKPCEDHSSCLDTKPQEPRKGDVSSRNKRNYKCENKLEAERHGWLQMHPMLLGTGVHVSTPSIENIGWFVCKILECMCCMDWLPSLLWGKKKLIIIPATYHTLGL